MKPDWATRLQRTFARKYDAGFAKGLMLGKAVATRDEQERIVGLLLRANCKLDGAHHSENLCGSPHHLGTLIALIKGEN